MRNLTMIKIDDRTDEQKRTHTIGIAAKDTFLSGWGLAAHGDSRCCWACHDHKIAIKVLQWVQKRKEMKQIRIVDLNPWGPELHL